MYLVSVFISLIVQISSVWLLCYVFTYSARWCSFRYEETVLNRPVSLQQFATVHSNQLGVWWRERLSSGWRWTPHIRMQWVFLLSPVKLLIFYIISRRQSVTDCAWIGVSKQARTLCTVIEFTLSIFTWGNDRVPADCAIFTWGNDCVPANCAIFSWGNDCKPADCVTDIKWYIHLYSTVETAAKKKRHKMNLFRWCIYPLLISYRPYSLVTLPGFVSLRVPLQQWQWIVFVLK